MLNGAFFLIRTFFTYLNLLSYANSNSIFSSKEVVFTNSDAESGVTSFEVAEINGKTVIFVGSYDGNIRIYAMEFVENDQFSVRRVFKINIGGGVWRIYSRILEDSCLELFGSSMYSGAFILNLEDFDCSQLKSKNIEDFHDIIELPKASHDADDPEHEEEKLIYGSVKNTDSAVICSYNERLLHFFNINHA